MQDKIETTAEALEAGALPRVHEVRTGDEEPLCGAEGLPDCVKKQPVASKSPAQWAYERTVVYLQKFEQTLDDSHELAVGFAGADAGVLRIEGMGYFDPDIVTFYGADASGAKMQLVQHVSQLSVVFRALPKARDHDKPQRIGFKLVQDLQDRAG